MIKNNKALIRKQVGRKCLSKKDKVKAYKKAMELKRQQAIEFEASDTGGVVASAFVRSRVKEEAQEIRARLKEKSLRHKKEVFVVPNTLKVGAPKHEVLERKAYVAAVKGEKRIRAISKAIKTSKRLRKNPKLRYKDLPAADIRSNWSSVESKNVMSHKNKILLDKDKSIGRTKGECIVHKKDGAKGNIDSNYKHFPRPTDRKEEVKGKAEWHNDMSILKF